MFFIIVLSESLMSHVNIPPALIFGCGAIFLFSVILVFVMADSQIPVWYQKEVSLKAKSRGCHLITNEIEKIAEIKKIKIGLCNILVKHTTASICLNENWDPDVRTDMEYMLNRLVPESTPFKHTLEGPDDMPSHVKTALLGSSVTIPITDGRLNLGQWQGIWFCEHRNHADDRNLVITIQGVPR